LHPIPTHPQKPCSPHLSQRNYQTTLFNSFLDRRSAHALCKPYPYPSPKPRAPISNILELYSYFNSFPDHSFPDHWVGMGAAHAPHPIPAHPPNHLFLKDIIKPHCSTHFLTTGPHTPRTPSLFIPQAIFFPKRPSNHSFQLIS